MESRLCQILKVHSFYKREHEAPMIFLECSRTVIILPRMELKRGADKATGSSLMQIDVFAVAHSYMLSYHYHRVATVAPRAGAWIETHYENTSLTTARRSRLARARGLKLFVNDKSEREPRSRLARARGLKLRDGVILQHSRSVAPRAGAWIETQSNGRKARRSSCRASRGRVD